MVAGEVGEPVDEAADGGASLVPNGGDGISQDAPEPVIRVAPQAVVSPESNSERESPL
jgi:hypothetical protein